MRRGLRRKTPARAETATCVPLIAAMFFVTFSSFDRSSMNIEESPIRIRARKPVASPIAMPPIEIAGSVDTNLRHPGPDLPYSKDLMSVRAADSIVAGAVVAAVIVTGRV